MKFHALDNENALLEKVAAGDKIAFTRIYEFYSNTVFNTAMIYIRDENECRDIVQQIFIRLWESREQLADVRNLNNYLFVATRNKVFNCLRTVLRRRRAMATLQDKLEAAGPEDSTTERILAKEYGQVLEQAIACLTPQQKRVYTLAEQQAFSFDQIAGELNLSKSTVKKHMELARQSVRRYVAGHLYPDLLPVLWIWLSCRIIF